LESLALNYKKPIGQHHNKDLELSEKLVGIVNSGSTTMLNSPPYLNQNLPVYMWEILNLFNFSG
jgi:hypothetical protein